MKTVKVSKQELLKKLNENRETHINEFTEMMQTYKKEVTKGLKKLLKDSKKETNWKPRTSLQITKPRSFTEEYNQIIGMLEMSVEDTFDISQDDYKKYVLNIWSWSSIHELNKTSYLKGI